MQHAQSGRRVGWFGVAGAITFSVWATESWSAVEYARVISRTPILEQVLTPRDVCRDETATVQPAKTGTGAVVGAIAGGVLGNQVGDGSGRVIATTVGAIGGAMIGNRLEPTPATRVVTTRRCMTEQVIEQRIAGYEVIYELGGKQYRTRLDRDPGETLAVEIAPVQMSTGSYSSAPSVYESASTVYRATPRVVQYPTPTYVNPRLALPSVGVHYVYVDRRSGHRDSHADRYRNGHRDGYRRDYRDDRRDDRHRWGERRKHRHDD